MYCGGAGDTRGGSEESGSAVGEGGDAGDEEDDDIERAVGLRRIARATR